MNPTIKAPCRRQRALDTKRTTVPAEAGNEAQDNHSGLRSDAAWGRAAAHRRETT
jgi:hypothetical protein